MSGRREPDAGLPDGFAPWVVRSETVDLSDLESADTYDLAAVACRYGIDLADGPGGSLLGLDDDDEGWRSWVITEIRRRQPITDVDNPG